MLDQCYFKEELLECCDTGENCAERRNMMFWIEEEIMRKMEDLAVRQEFLKRI